MKKILENKFVDQKKLLKKNFLPTIQTFYDKNQSEIELLAIDIIGAARSYKSHNPFENAQTWKSCPILCKHSMGLGGSNTRGNSLNSSQNEPIKIQNNHSSGSQMQYQHLNSQGPLN